MKKIAIFMMLGMSALGLSLEASKPEAKAYDIKFSPRVDARVDYVLKKIKEKYPKTKAEKSGAKITNLTVEELSYSAKWEYFSGFIFLISNIPYSSKLLPDEFLDKKNEGVLIGKIKNELKTIPFYRRVFFTQKFKKVLFWPFVKLCPDDKTFAINYHIAQGYCEQFPRANMVANIAIVSTLLVGLAAGAASIYLGYKTIPFLFRASQSWNSYQPGLKRGGLQVINGMSMIGSGALEMMKVSKTLVPRFIASRIGL